MKNRLDALLVARGYALDLAQARALIGAGQVLVDGLIVDKAGSPCIAACAISLKPRPPYVSRGGEKLAAALAAFKVAPQGWICIDVGCSTGGFSDCLLQHGAARVYAVDVGYGVLDWRIRQDSRVVVLERTNARALTRSEIPESLDLAVIDASFISLRPLLAPLPPLFAKAVRIIALVKPQFELPRGKVPQGGVVRDPDLHQEAVDLAAGHGRELGFEVVGSLPSPLLGAKGNREFLLYLTGNNGNHHEQV